MNKQLGMTEMLMRWSTASILLICAGCVDVRCLPRRVHFLPSSLTWDQTKTIPVKAANEHEFYQCLSAAVSNLPGVSVGPKYPGDYLVSMHAEAMKTMPPLGFQAAYKNGQAIELSIYSATCPMPSNEQEKQLASLLDSVGDAISHQCGRGN